MKARIKSTIMPRRRASCAANCEPSPANSRATRSAAHAIVEAVESGNPPRHLLLGNDAYEGATAKLEELRKILSAWEAVARGADFPKEQMAKRFRTKTFMCDRVLDNCFTNF